MIKISPSNIQLEATCKITGSKQDGQIVDIH